MEPTEYLCPGCFPFGLVACIPVLMVLRFLFQKKLIPHECSNLIGNIVSVFAAAAAAILVDMPRTNSLLIDILGRLAIFGVVWMFSSVLIGILLGAAIEK